MMPEIVFCNELIAREWPRLADQARFARRLGASGLELAPGTLGAAPERLSGAEVAEIRREVEDEGVRIAGLHWLLSDRPGASITDPAAASATQEILVGLTGLCAALGGDVLVHGSPGQRRPVGSAAEAVAGLPAFFAPVAEAAERHGVTYCIEPLAREETEIVNTVAEGAELVDAVGSPAFRTMIDCSAAGRTEPPVADLMRAWLGTGKVAHLHFNDTNRGAPGTGSDSFGDILTAVREAGWAGPLSVEPFRLDGSLEATFGTAVDTLRSGWGA